MEVLSPFEGLDEGEWISPRISFSQDFQFSGRCSPKTHYMDSPEDDFCFMFRHSANVDLHSDDSMLSADELFFDGKVRPLREDAGFRAVSGYFDEQNVGFERSLEENPRCHSMTIDSCRGEGWHGRVYMSLNSSRCSSPTRTMSMPRTTPTSPTHSSISCRKSSSVLSGRMVSSTTSSEKVLSSSASSQQLSTSIPASSSKYSSRLKDFFKLKKGNLTKDASVPLFPSSPSSAEISRESVHSSGSASCRLPSRSFWPFSRSNSAGESKTAPAVSPPPRRSNSAGEGKTTSSSLLPMNGPSSEQATQRHDPATTNTTLSVNSMASSTEATPSINGASKRGLPPLPNSNSRKTSGFLVSARCRTDVAAVALQSATMLVGTASNGTIGPATSSLIDNEADSNKSQSGPPACANESIVCIDEGKAGGDVHQIVPDATPVSRKGRDNAAANSGKPVRTAAHNSVTQHFARTSPGRRGVWNSPGRSHGGRVSIRYLDRGSLSSRGHIQPKDILSRDGASGRISPVLNVAVPSLRGSKASSKSKMFRLGHLFSKKDRAALYPAINGLPPADCPNQV